KTATRIDNVPIAIYNRNLCADHLWQGPDPQGRYFCKPGYFDAGHPPPDLMRWLYDWGSYLVAEEPETIEIFPHLTLAATGRMDPSIPGGHVPHVLGSPVLADPDWEACSCPETFAPDEMANADAMVEGIYTFTS